MSRLSRQRNTLRDFAPPTPTMVAIKVVLLTFGFIGGFVALMFGALWFFDRKIDEMPFLLGVFFGLPFLYYVIAREQAKRMPLPPEIRTLLLEGQKAKLWSTSHQAQQWLLRSHRLSVGSFVVEHWLETLQKEASANPLFYERPAWLTTISQSASQEIEVKVVDPMPVWQRTLSLQHFPGEKPSFYGSTLSAKLLPKHVVCSNESPNLWACLERSTGEILWERKVGRPNKVYGVENGVIVASELRAGDSPLIWSYGLYGLSLETGELLWISHGRGWWGRFTRLLDAVPDFRNELRDTPLYLQAGAIITQRGRLVNPSDGSDIGATEPDGSEMEGRAGAAYHLRRYRFFACGEYGTLRAGTPEKPEVQKDNIVGLMPMQLFLKERSGQVAWTLDLSMLPKAYTPMTLVYQAPYLFFRIASPLSSIEEGDSDQSEFYAIWIVDIRSGNLVQKIPVSEKPVFNGALQAVDSENILVSYSAADTASQTLLCFGLNLCEETEML